MRTLSIDIESFASIDLGKAGVYKYASAPDFEILLFAYAYDDDDIQIIDLARGERLPQELVNALSDESIIKTAFNATFERICLSRHIGQHLSSVSWRCTAVQAAQLALPMNLDGVAKVLGLGEQKMKEGKDLIRYFCIPCKPTQTNGGRNRNLPRHAPEKWRIFSDYCKQDVEVERAIRRKIEKYPISDFEQRLYILDQQINDRGVMVDMQLVKKAINCDQLHGEETFSEAQKLTGLANPNSVAQLKMWLFENGVSVESLSKKNVTDLAREAEGEVERLLNLRLQLAKTSIRKYEAMERAVCPDGRVRGLLQFYGANRTGRWCLAEGMPVRVLTFTGLVQEKPIEAVLHSDKVWDGDKWVDHEGVVFSGEKEVISWDGVTATPDHIVYLNENESTTLGDAQQRRQKLWRGNGYENV